MGMPIDRLTIHGFKSIERLDDFALGPINVLIGANGAGKSSFVDFFRMLGALAGEHLRRFIANQGGADALFFNGAKHSLEIDARVMFGDSQYVFSLDPQSDGSVSVYNEAIDMGTQGVAFSGGLTESLIHEQLRIAQSQGAQGGNLFSQILETLRSWVVYHFHDTSSLSPMRRDQEPRDDERFRHDASNIAAFLYRLKEIAPGSYDLIRDTVRLVAPFFDDFLLRPRQVGPAEKIRLEWRQKGSDFPFQPYQLSDGTLRFICLATALLQPNPPSTIVIDEPELGLHPYALSVFAGMVKSAAARTQIVLSTQSPALVDFFEPEEIIVVNRREGRSEFERLDSASLAPWLEEYSIGELWQKNVVRGGPVGE
jgi:predicted ATPase